MIRKFIRVLQNQIFARDGLSIARELGVRFGKDCKFISVTANTFGSEPYLIELGDHVELAGAVRFLPHDGAVWVFRETEPDIDAFAPIKVGSNVFIGYGAVVLPGAQIGDNCIIGAGSVVSGKIPSGSVAAGVPARRLKSIEEYRQKIDDRILLTKGMTKSEKKEFLIRHFDLP